MRVAPHYCKLSTVVMFISKIIVGCEAKKTALCHKMTKTGRSYGANLTDDRQLRNVRVVRDLRAGDTT